MKWIITAVIFVSRVMAGKLIKASIYVVYFSFRLNQWNNIFFCSSQMSSTTGSRCVLHCSSVPQSWSPGPRNGLPYAHSVKQCARPAHPGLCCYTFFSSKFKSRMVLFNNCVKGFKAAEVQNIAFKWSVRNYDFWLWFCWELFQKTTNFVITINS